MFEGRVTAPIVKVLQGLLAMTVYWQKKFIQDNLSALWLPSSGSTTENSQSAFANKKILATLLD